jgi:hypothetical protein
LKDVVWNEIYRGNWRRRTIMSGSSWVWLYGSWIYNYLCNQCLTPLRMWVRIPLRQCVFDTTLCDKCCHWLVTVRWFSLGAPVSSTNKTDCHDVTDILLKVALNTINHTKEMWIICIGSYFNMFKLRINEDGIITFLHVTECFQFNK